MSIDIWLHMEIDTGGPELTDINLGDDWDITHNVAPMWQLAGCYDALYKSNGRLAGEILPELDAALVDMQNYPAKYKELNPPNGWGDYDSAIYFLSRVIDNFRKYPKAIIGVSK